jgi:hypothetical protein
VSLEGGLAVARVRRVVRARVGRCILVVEVLLGAVFVVDGVMIYDGGGGGGGSSWQGG